jgi:hypothetical protein
MSDDCLMSDDWLMSDDVLTSDDPEGHHPSPAAAA